MKKILMIALLLTFAVGTAIAQQNFGPNPGGIHAGGHGGPNAGGNFGGDPVERLTDQLGLDEAQVADITLIFEDARALHEQQREQFQEQFCAARAETHALIMEVLTAEQQAEFETMQQERANLRLMLDELRQARGENGMGGGRGMPACDF